MLAKASSTERPKFSAQGLQLQSPLLLGNTSCSHLAGNNNGRRRHVCSFFCQKQKRWPRTRAMVASSIRTPSVTSRVYHLIDCCSPISSNDLFSRNPTNANRKFRRPTTQAMTQSTRLPQAFRILGFRRTKALFCKISPTDRYTGQNTLKDERSVTVAAKLQENDETRKARPPKTHDAGGKTSRPDVLASRNSASWQKGWGMVESERETDFRMSDVLKQQKRLSLDTEFFSQNTFRELGVRDYMIEALKGQLFFHPSHIQAMAFVPVVEGKTCIIADQSGSGKTLSYLVPIIQRLREDELLGFGKSFSNRPRAVILVPTTELASQVLNVCRSISKFGVPIRSMIATGGFHLRTQLENLQKDVDVLIATPGRLAYLNKEGALQLSNLICAVLDEVDVLFKDEDFEPALQLLINSSPVNTQYLFVTATLPKEVYSKLIEIFPDCEVISGPHVHRISPHLEEVLVDCSGDGAEKTPATAFINKTSALRQLVNGSPVPKTIVFCNKIETCRKVENQLKRFDRRGSSIRVLPFHAALAPELRLENMKEFLSHSNDSMFMVCTDRASRGIDFTGVDHVVLFDFPRDPSEYVRRVGRTARGASVKGKAFIFVVGKQVSLAQRIMKRNQKGHPLHDVPFIDYNSI